MKTKKEQDQKDEMTGHILLLPSSSVVDYLRVDSPQAIVGMPCKLYSILSERAVYLELRSSIPGHRFLHSGAHSDLVVPLSQASMAQHRSFALVLNNLPSNLQIDLLGLSLPHFHKHLKLFMVLSGLEHL